MLNVLLSSVHPQITSSLKQHKSNRNTPNALPPRLSQDVFSTSQRSGNVQEYFKDIKKITITLLTQEQEVELGKNIQAVFKWLEEKGIKGISSFEAVEQLVKPFKTEENQRKKIEELRETINNLQKLRQELKNKKRQKPLDTKLTKIRRELANLETLNAVPANELKIFHNIYNNGLRAREQFVKANLRLVALIAQDYQNKGLSLDDLIQEGILGVIRAAEKFDHTKGFKFSTYAARSIRNAITKAIRQASTIPMPQHVHDSWRQIKQATQKLTEALGRTPTPEEIAAELGITVETLEAHMVAKRTQNTTSLNLKVGEGEMELSELILASEGTSPDSSLRNALNAVLKELREREQKVLSLRFGLDDGKEYTYEEIAAKLNTSPENIRQISVRALGKLRNADLIRRLRDYLN